MNTPDDLKELLDNIEKRLTKIEGRFQNNLELVKLSEQIVRLKGDEAQTSDQIHYNQYQKLNCKLSTIETRLTKIEAQLNSISKITEEQAHNWSQTVDLYFKRSEANDVISKKFAIVESLIENSEKKLISMIEKNTENTLKEVNRKYDDISNSIDEVGNKAKDNDCALLKDALCKVENDNLLMMKMVNEMNMKTQNIQWMHDELMSIKRRQIQILGLLNEQSNEENDFLKNMSEPNK